MRFRTAVASAVLLAAASQASAAEKPNVLLIVSDDLRDTVGCYGNAFAKTPNIDRLAARAVRFEHAYAQYPVCNPSRTSFLTGLRCEQTHVVDNNTQFRTRLPDIVTLPQLLRQNGWRTMSYGKIFHAGEAKGEIRNGWLDLGRSWDEAIMSRETSAGKVIEGRNLTGGKLPWCEWGATAGTDDDQPDGQTAKLAIALMERLTTEGKAWMIGAGFHRPHDPFISPKKYFDLYPPGSLKLWHDPADATPLRAMSIAGQGFRKAFDAFTDVDRDEFQRAYYAGVSFMDAQVGRLLDTMDRLKLWDKTIVIFIGDHGYHLNERNWWNKNTLFERTCRVPFIVWTPDGKQGAVCNGLIEMVDIYPTIIDYCGLSAPHQLAGQSLRPLLNFPGRKGRDAAFTLVVRGKNAYGQAVRDDRWRFIQWSDGTAELYDEQKDQLDMRDVYGDAANQQVIAGLRGQLTKIGPYMDVQRSNAKDVQTTGSKEPK